jgi:general secretion pathway protein C
MIDARSNDWITRLQGKAPKVVTYVLAALIVIEAGRIAYAFLSKPVKSPQPVVNAAAAPRNPNLAFNAQGLADAHLFGVAPPAELNQDPNNAPMSSANLMLAGTIATQDPKHGVAIISDGGGPTKVYSVGDRIGGAALHSVYLDHVLLDRNGALETLNLPRQMLGGTRPGPIANRPGVDSRTVAAVDNIRRMVQQDPGMLDQVMRTVPSYDNAAGKLRGFRAFPGRNRAIFSKLGLRSGDLVTAVNGAPLDDPQRAQEVFATIQTSDHVTVSVERGGQKQDITLNIAQLASQAAQDLQSQANGNAEAPSNSGAAEQPPPARPDMPSPPND